MPPGAAEIRHHHERAQQFFYILTGEVLMEINGENMLIPAGSGVRILPGTRHQIRNPSSSPGALPGRLAAPQPRRPHRRLTRAERTHASSRLGYVRAATSPAGNGRLRASGRIEAQPSGHNCLRPTTPAARSAPRSRVPNPARELHIQKSFHLPPKTLPVAVPPDFFHPRHAVDIQIFHPHHFVQPKAPVSAAHAAGLHAAVRSFADAEARNHIIHHDCAGMDAPRQPLAAFAVARPHTRRQSIFGIVGQPHGFVVVCRTP